MSDPTRAHIAIRLDREGREWMDLPTISGSHQVAADRAARDDLHNIPEWAADNPLQRIAKVEIREIGER